MMQTVLAEHLGLEEPQVRVVCHDVGGSFGVKIHVYGDEMATAVASRLLRRPVRFLADRLESFVTDIHARDHVVQARIAVTQAGDITAFTAEDTTGIGPFSAYPRTSAVEANQVINLIGGPYTCANYRARTRVVFQNKGMMSQYRAVGHPIATAVTEGLVDLAARRLGLDPVAMRRRNLIADDAYPCQSPSGMRFEGLSHHAALDRLMALMDYDALRADQAAARARGVYRGIGLASFIELTNPGPAFYGVGGARISAQDGATVRLDASGSLVVQASVTEQGQGTEAILTQIAAEAMGVLPGRVRVQLGDTDVTPYGGGTWASRGAGVGEVRRRGRQAVRCAPTFWRSPAASCRRSPTRSTSRTVRSWTWKAVRSASRSPTWPASRIFARTRCLPACKPSWSPPGITFPATTPSPSPTACRRRGWRSTPKPVS